MAKKTKHSISDVQAFRAALDSVLTLCMYEIHEEWGLELLDKYINNLMLVQSGAITPLQLKRDFSPVQSITYLNESFEEVGSRKKLADDRKFAMLSLSGVMRLEGGWCHDGVRGLADNLYKLYADETIAGIYLRTTTGGGEATAGQLLSSALLDRNKPVLAHIELGASAGFRTILNTDYRLLAHSAAGVGSIGSMFSYNKKRLKELKDTMVDIYSRISPMKNLEFRELMKGNKEPLYKRATANAQNLVDAVLEAIPNIDTAALEGGMYYGQEAIDANMVHGIGTRNEALTILTGLAEKAGTIATSYSTTAIIHNKNSQDMTFSEFLLNEWNRVFGTTLKASDEAGNKTAIQAQKPLADLVEEAVSSKLMALNSSFSDLQNKLTAETEARQTLEASVVAAKATNATSMQALQTKYNDLEVKATALQATNVALTSEIAGLRGGEEAGNNDGGGGAAPHGAEAQFVDALAKVTVSNESKY